MEVVQCTFILDGRTLGTFHVTENYLTIGAAFTYNKETRDTGTTSYLYVERLESFNSSMREDKFCVATLTSVPPVNKIKGELEMLDSTAVDATTTGLLPTDESLWTAVFLRMLPSAIESTTWTLEGKSVTTGEGKVRLAGIWADYAVNEHRQRFGTQPTTGEPK